MIVISDTTPIISLLKAQHLNLLEELYGQVIIPDAVYRELTTNLTYIEESEEVRQSTFLKVEKVENVQSVRVLQSVTGLDEGESEALILYEEKHADLLLMDEHKGRGIAARMSAKYVGTVGMLMLAYDRKIINSQEVEHILSVLIEKNIRISRNLCNKVMHYVGLESKF